MVNSATQLAKEMAQLSGALEKLEYVDKVVTGHRSQEPLVDNVPQEYEGPRNIK